MHEELRKQIAFENIVIETPSGDVSSKDSKYRSLVELGFKPINKPMMKGKCIHIIKKEDAYDYQVHSGRTGIMSSDSVIALVDKLNIKTIVYDMEMNNTDDWYPNDHKLNMIFSWSRMVNQYGELLIICKDNYVAELITTSINFINKILSTNISDGLLTSFVDSLFNICSGVNYYGHPVGIIISAFKDDLLYKFKDTYVTVKGDNTTIRVADFEYCDDGNHPYHIKFHGKQQGRTYNSDVNIYRSSEDRIKTEYLKYNMCADSDYHTAFELEKSKKIKKELDRISALKISNDIVEAGKRALSKVKKLVPK